MFTTKIRKVTSACLLGLVSCAITAHPVSAQLPVGRTPVVASNVAVNEAASYSDPAHASDPTPTSPNGGNNPNGNANGPAANGGNVTVSREEMEQMRRTIELLNDRVKDLENKLNKSGEAVAVAPQASLPSEAAVAVVEQQPQELPPNDKTKDSSVLHFFEKTEISGLVDVYYGYNFNRPVSTSNVLQSDNQLHAFDTKHNQLSLNLIKLVLDNKPTEDSRLGFRLDLAFGPGTEIVHATEPGGSDVFRHLEQGYLSYLAPIGKGLQIDFGKYVTHHGFEVIESKDNWNYTRSFLFTLGIPFYHFGVRATYPVNDKVSLMFGVNNGYNDVVDNNGRKSYSAQLAIKPNSKLTIIQNYTGGPEQTGNKDDNRQLFDTVVSFVPNKSLSLATNYVYGFDRINGVGVHWQGIVGFARYQINEHFALSPRFEYYDDHDGFTSGLKQELKSFTLTGEHILKGGLITRMEYRRDFSNQNFFIKPQDRLVKAQSTLTLGIVYAFSSKQ